MTESLSSDRPRDYPEPGPCVVCGGPFIPGHGGMIGDRQFCTDACMQVAYPPEPAGDALVALEASVVRHRRALGTAAQAGDERARAAFLAREAGATLTEIAEALGVARPNVPALVRRGARTELLFSDAPRHEVGASG